MDYYSRVRKVIERHKVFFRDKNRGGFLIQIILPKERPIKDSSLSKWDWDSQLNEFISERCRAFENILAAKKNLDDDFLPAACPSFGIAEHSAYVGGNVTFTKDTSWTEPIIDTWEDLRKLELKDDNYWLNLLLNGMQCMKKKAQDKFLIGLRGSFSPMDLANALRGNRILEDFFLDKKMVELLLEFCVKAVIWYLEKQEKVIGQVEGGTPIPYFGLWVPEKAVGSISNDLSSMCSSAIYSEFGFKYEQKIIDHFGGGLFHIHIKGRHILPFISKLKGLLLLEITEDPNEVRPIDIVEEIIDSISEVPLMIRCEPEDVFNKINVLKKARVILVVPVKDVQMGQKVIGFVRMHSTIL